MHVKCISRKLSHCLPSPPPTFPALSFPWLTSKAIQDMGRQQDAAPGERVVWRGMHACATAAAGATCVSFFLAVLPSLPEAEHKQQAKQQGVSRVLIIDAVNIK